MKAILVEEPFKIGIVEVPNPVIEKEDEVIIKVISGGICGSDIGIYKGTNSLATYPRIIGHEFGGEVVEIGSAVTGVQIGDVVAVDPVRSCGTCYACEHDRHNVCSTLKVTGVHLDGGFSEFVKAPEYAVYKINTDKIERSLSCMVEPYSIGEQVNHRAETAKGDKVLVMGSGPIGIGVMQVAKARGAEVMMTDVVDRRLERALAMGADHVVNVSKEDLTKAVMDFTENEGMPVIMDTVCSLDSVPLALELACPAGRVVVLGLSSTPAQIPQVNITKKELTVLGSRLSNYRFPEVIEGFESGVLTPEKMRTHRFHYTQIEEALELIKEHPEEVCKVVLTFE